MEAQVIAEIVNSIPMELYFFLWKGMVIFFLTIMAANWIRNLATYLRLRFSDIFSKRTVIIYDGFEGVVEEISMTGIFIRNKEGVTKFVSLNRWYMGDIRYPNHLGRDKKMKTRKSDETE